MKMKRRVIYMSDEDWAQMKARAEAEGTSMSDLFRLMVMAGGVGLEEGTSHETRREILGGLKVAAAEFREATGIDGKLEVQPDTPFSVGDPSFNSRPFTPVPKKGK